MWSTPRATPSYTRKYFTVVFHRGSATRLRTSQVSAFSFCFLLFLRNDGGLNFFFFLDGDLEGEPSGVPPCGLAGGAAGVEVSLVERAFIPFSNSSVVCFSSSPPFWMAGESVFVSSAPSIGEKQTNTKVNIFSSQIKTLKLGGAAKRHAAADEHACLMSSGCSVLTSETRPKRQRWASVEWHRKGQTDTEGDSTADTTGTQTNGCHYKGLKCDTCGSN